MKKFLSIPPLHRSIPGFIKHHFPRILQAILILGFIYAALFAGVRECDGLWAPSHTPHETNVPHSTDTPILPTNPPVIPSNTPVAPTSTPIVPTNTPIAPTNTSVIPTGTTVPTNTNNLTSTLTNTPDCTSGLTPTATGIPTCIPISTPTQTLTETEAPTDTARPGGPSSTPRPKKILAPTNMAGITVTSTVSPTATGLGADSTSAQPAAAQGSFGASATATLTPTNSGASVPGPGIGTGSNLKLNTKDMPLLFLLAALVVGGGAFFAFTLRDRREVFDPSQSGGAAAILAINPTAVGAVGFSAWLAEQAPLLNEGEKVVISKVGNGISSAIHLVGGISDLKKISEMGTQEVLQLTASSPFPISAIRGIGFSGG